MSHFYAVGAGVAAILFCGVVFGGTDSTKTMEAAVKTADAAYEADDWSGCGEHYAQASRLASGGVHSGASYNAACCYALAGDADRAFAELTRAIEAGYRDRNHMQQDTDLTSLHEDPRWSDAVTRAKTNADAYAATINTELLELYEQDQADRRPAPGSSIDWSLVGPRDAARRARVTEIVTGGGAKAADDFYHAAMVFQHGNEPEDIGQAREWALQAVELKPDHRAARWLAAASLDRYLMYQGKPQKYGTQFKTVEGRWVLWEVDPSVTDEERAEWHVPPLHEAQARAEAMNRKD